MRIPDPINITIESRYLLLYVAGVVAVVGYLFSRYYASREKQKRASRQARVRRLRRTVAS